jgi:hypothetical protein
VKESTWSLKKKNNVLSQERSDVNANKFLGTEKGKLINSGLMQPILRVVFSSICSLHTAQHRLEREKVYGHRNVAYRKNEKESNNRMTM